MDKKEMFAQRLKEQRELRGWKQTQLAEKASVTPQTISAYEKQAKMPALDTALTIAGCLGVSLDYLCGNDNSGRQMKTLGDVVKHLKEVSELVRCSVRAETIKVNLPQEELDVIDFDEEGNPIFDDTTMAGHFIVKNYYIAKYFQNYNTMRRLLEIKTINKNLFDSWESGELDKLNKMSVDKYETCKYDLEDPELPLTNSPNASTKNITNE